MNTRRKRGNKPLVFLMSSMLLLYSTDLFAQKGETQVNVEFRIRELGINNLEKKVDPVFKFFLGKEDGVLLNSTGSCYKFYSKANTNDFILPDPKYPGWERLKPFTIPIESHSAFTITMECFVNNKGDACVFDRKDEFHSITEKIIDLNSFTPGDYSDTFRIADKDNHFYSTVELRYTLVPPASLKPSTALQPINVADQNLVIHSSYDLSNRDKLKFIWEYSDDKGASWSRLPGSKEDPFSISINPLKDIFGSQLAGTEQIYFRLKVNSRDTFSISDTLKAIFTPAPPAFSSSDVKVLQTCKGYNNGALTISNILSVKNRVLYILRRAAESKGSCSLTNPSQANCQGFVRSGEINTGTLEIKNLPADSYSLILYNPDIPVGDIYTSFNFNVQSFEDLNIKNIVQKNPDCNNDLGGQILVNAEGGSYTDYWQISINPVYGTKEFNTQQKTIGFRNLPEGNYTIEVQDGCGTIQDRNVTLKKPEKLHIESIEVIKTPEQAVVIKLKNGSGRYRATISDKNEFSRTIDSMINNIIPVSGKGIYRIRIEDKTDPACLTVDTTCKVGYHITIFHHGRVEEAGQAFALNGSAPQPLALYQLATRVALATDQKNAQLCGTKGRVIGCGTGVGQTYAYRSSDEPVYKL